MNAPEIAEPEDRWAAAKFAILCVGLLSGLICFWALDVHKWLGFEQAQGFIEQAGWWGVVLFVVIFAISIIMMMPASILTLLAATLFEPITAYLALLTGAMLGASGCFALGRVLGRGFVAQQLKGSKHKWLKAIERMDASLAEHGFKAMLYLRLGPLPFAIPSYAAALSSLRFRDFFWGTCIGSLPQILVFVFLGDTLKTLLARGVWEMLTAWESWVAVGSFALVFMLPFFLPKLSASTDAS